MKEMWEILVPTVSNEGKPFRLRYHRVWDKKVRAITGGLTIMPVAKGQWLHGDKLYSERMIPVRIVGTREQIDQIVAMTAIYYDQITVLAYKIASDVIMYDKPAKLDRKDIVRWELCRHDILRKDCSECRK